MSPLERLKRWLSQGPFIKLPSGRYPNAPFWAALADGARVTMNGERYRLSVVSCGELVMPSGRLVVCDPFAVLQRDGNAEIKVPPGRYEVRVTMADVSGKGDGSHMREAYASLILDPASREAERRIITPGRDGEPCDPEIDDDGSFFGFGVDAGTACFADAGSIRDLMPADRGSWHDSLFESGTPESWFDRMDDHHIRPGIANITLPMAMNGENIVIFHSGWGDGFYPVVGGYDSNGKLVRVHVDFLVVFDHPE